MTLAGLLHPKVNPPAPAPEVPAAVVPRCGDVDPLSGAVCNRVLGHHVEPRHKAVDRDFEIWWDRG